VDVEDVPSSLAMDVEAAAELPAADMVVAVVVLDAAAPLLEQRKLTTLPTKRLPIKELALACSPAHARWMNVCADSKAVSHSVEQDCVPPMPEKSLSSQLLTGVSYASVQIVEKPMIGCIAGKDADAFEIRTRPQRTTARAAAWRLICDLMPAFGFWKI
jgi:hypothetical protein